jgi:hypothetical protein
MPVTLPTLGKADWTDYVDYWRDADATWIQDRIVLRAQDDAGRDALGQTPGGVVYNTAKDALELRSSAGGYKTITPIPASLVVDEIAGQTTISYQTAAGKGVVYTIDTVAITAPKFNAINGVLTADATGVMVKTGAKTAKLTTDATSLVSDSPVSAPSLVLTGSGTVLDATNKAVVVGTLTSGALTAASLTSAGAVTGGTLSVGGASINSSGRLTTPSGQGMVSNQGIFYGDANGGVMRHVNQTGPYFQAAANNIYAGGSLSQYFDVQAQMRVFRGQAVQWFRADGAQTGYLATSFYGDPGVGNAPEGAILIT